MKFNTSFVAILTTALVVAVMVGEVDDAPGLVLVGVLMIVGAIGLGVRAGRLSM